MSNEMKEWFDVLMDAPFPGQHAKAIPSMIMMIMRQSKTNLKYSETLAEFGEYLIKTYGGK